MKLIIVESPAKIKKIKGYAGPDYDVAASVGHIRDVIVNKETGSIGVDREHGHALIYGISPDKKDTVANLQSKARAAGPGNVYLATDPDREGEAISWHLCQVLGLDPRTTKRITFQEITEKAVRAALAAPRTIDLPLVYAQEARRAVDRLVGFTVSPVLNRKIAQGLSAGRVQSVAVRLVVEREREITRFTDRFSVPVTATVQTTHGEQLRARRTAEPFESVQAGQAYLQQIGSSPSFGVVSVEKKPVERQPQPAFSTSSLQQEGVKKLKFKVQKIAELSQKLFEAGHITYIRTDSVNLGEEATEQAQAQISSQFGADQFQARQVKNKDGAQEAHEAIRPTHWENASAGDTADEQALYRLIYTRALASQMIAAQYDQTTITLAPAVNTSDTYTSSTRVQTRLGYLAVYQDADDEADEGADEDETTLKNPVQQGEALTLIKLEARQSYSRPPKRFGENTLVKELETRQIGRPSTYASIINTIQARGYISTGSVAGKKVTSQVLTWQGGQITTSQKTETLGADKDKMLPTASGTQVTEFLEKNFSKIMDYKFTATCEAIFDKIAANTQTYQAFVPMFDQNLLDWVAQANAQTPDRAELQKRLVGQFEGTEMLIGTGKNGPYILHAEKYYNIPEGVSHATLSEAQAQAIITQRRLSAPRELGQHQAKPVVVGQGPKGVYIKWDEKYFNVPEGTVAADVTLVQAQGFITQAQEAAAKEVLGQHQGKPVVVRQGPKGVYVKWDDKYFNVPEGTAATDVTLVQAVGFITQAQEAAAKSILATVGKYSIGKNEYGLFVTDGTVKAKFKPGVTEDEAKATDAATCAAMIKSYKAWKAKNGGGASKPKK